MSAGLSVLQELSSGRTLEAFYRCCAVYPGTAPTASVHLPSPTQEARSTPSPLLCSETQELAWFVSSRDRARRQPAEDTTLKMESLFLL